MSKSLLLVYDDEKRAKERYTEKIEEVEALRKRYKVRALVDEDFKEMVRELRGRVLESRKRELEDDDWNSRFDEASIFIIDYDLVEAEEIPENGEDVAYYLRCFSKCEYIIGLNQFGLRAFDLTLVGHLDSYSDINIGASDLSNIGLWTGRVKGYRPWYWPSVVDNQESFKARFEDIQRDFTKPIREVLEIPIESFLYLSSSAFQRLGTDEESVSEVTFEDFYENSDMVLRGKDKREGRFSDRLKARIAAARISKWLERAILPGQDILVDAPHLVSRFPSLLEGSPSKISSWNATTNLDRTGTPGLNRKAIEQFELTKNYWLSRPVWFWGDVAECVDISEVAEPWQKVESGFVFAEDASRFIKRKECREFVSNVDSPFNRRFVKYYEGVDYRPRVNLYLE